MTLRMRVIPWSAQQWVSMAFARTLAGEESQSSRARRFHCSYLLWLSSCWSCPAVWAVTVMKAVGHGDCYVIISDGRAVVADAGPGNATDFVLFLTSGDLHYDRIMALDSRW